MSEAAASTAPESTIQLRERTTLGIGGPPRFFYRPENLEALRRVLESLDARGITWLVLGGGSNLVVADSGVDAAVISTERFRFVKIDGDRIVAGAGVSLPGLVDQAKQRGLTGIERLAGIPGSIGGAVAMNAGGKHGAIGDVLVSAVTIDGGGTVRRRTRDELNPRYRTANLNGEIVLEAELLLKADLPLRVAGMTREILEEKKRTQPLIGRSAGCVFRNPLPDHAGRLIELAGAKGLQAGDVKVSPKHANFFLNVGKGSSADFLALAESVRARVLAATGQRLEFEVKVWK
ncbi:MAG: UDP-N-acetylmuramate dehydrogenase [Planctomycetes bacterium]|nr:UDP-N-acetylmuramate dehydrogenase [Planctomycetota bacterium]MBI3844421.1 UDP-N-acetylmuramate dehydrogenase [Planctomycetota bacterium]